MFDKIIKSKQTPNLFKNYAPLIALMQLNPQHVMAQVEIAQQIIKQNQSNIVRHVGDRIVLWDTSRLTEASDKPENDDYFDYTPEQQLVLVKKPSIVTETGVNFKSTEFERTHILDLVIFNKHLNKFLRTSSDFVKTYNKRGPKMRDIIL